MREEREHDGARGLHSRGERIVVLIPAEAASARKLEQLDSLVGAAPAWTARDGVLAEALTG